MDGVLLAGRILFVAIFVMSGVMGHIVKRADTIAYARQSGAPLPELTVPATGVLMLAGGVMVALGAWADLGALLLAGFLVPTTFFMHRFWGIEDAMMAQNQQAHFMKNMALIGAALMAFAFFQQFGEGIDFTLTDPLFK